MSIITVENLSKSYVIGHQGRGDDGLRHVLDEFLRRPKDWLKQRRQQRELAREEFWALKDVSFEIKQGDVVGIIGRNGAGKSTLLKILSRITEPTSGRITIDGRVASLLEVGTGFHQELTGRENIFLNGAILGMSKVEIKRKFDEIVAFSEVEKFLDTPVKRYSSGMYMRLAFAVAAHLEPEILIVDEVLAVGDASFQKKCLGKMQEVSKNQGRTVLFVSHNMAAVRQLCSAGILLRQGRVQSAGSIATVVDSYLNHEVEYGGLWNRNPAAPRGQISFETVRIFQEAGKTSGHVDCTGGFSVEMRVAVRAPVDDAQISLRLTNQYGVPVLTTCNTDVARQFVPLPAGEHVLRIDFPANFLVPGTYTLLLAAHTPKVRLFDVLEDVIAICVEEIGSVTSVLKDDRLGVVNPVLPWNYSR